MAMQMRFAKTGKPFTLPVDLPDGSKVILERRVFGNFLGAVTINEVDRTYAFGQDTRAADLNRYAGRNWRARLYRDAMDALECLLG
jgi:hypothetical protein